MSKDEKAGKVGKAPTKLVKRIGQFRKKKVRFIRQEGWRYGRLKSSWRKPKGIDSKMRLKRKGYPPSPKVGYRLPRDIRGRHPSGFFEVIVYRAEDLRGINPKTHAARIAHTIGARKREEVRKEAEKLGLKILNPPKQSETKPKSSETERQVQGKATPPIVEKEQNESKKST